MQARQRGQYNLLKDPVTLFVCQTADCFKKKTAILEEQGSNSPHTQTDSYSNKTSII